MNKETGGQAFPRNVLDHGHGIISAYDPGMTLRDYFAAKALECVPPMTCFSMKDGETYEQYIARNAFKIADAMLKEREK